ncbi:MAG: UDP-2,3-diacylglucosamine diphosphatase [Bauldia sp.]|nr:UDP-2,3-diacylglucosamine diphosphatase [Bauldia sp.]
MLHRPLPVRLRTLFVSDLHLGTRGCQAERFLAFLSHYEADTIFLVGDIVDGWKLKRGWYWPESHSAVMQALLERAAAGARLVYIPGNHDEFMRNYAGTQFGPVEVIESAVHETVDGRRFLVIHGDQFDVVVRWAPWLSALGAQIYNVTLAANGIVNRVRRSLGIGYWSLSDWTKRKVKNAVNIIGDYEQALVTEARRVGAEGVICGHIHHAAMHDRFGIAYVNTGDWMESCTAAVEHHDGRLEIIRWTEPLPARRKTPAQVPNTSGAVEADAA